MAKLFVKNFKEGLLGKLTKSIRNKKISQKYGFVVLNWLLTIIAAPLPIFQYANFWKMCENCAHRKINDKLLLDSGLCLKIHQWVIPSNQEKEIFFICSEDTAQTGCSRSIFMWSLASFYLTWRKICDGFRLFWLGAKSFQTIHCQTSNIVFSVPQPEAFRLQSLGQFLGTDTYYLDTKNI